MSIEEIKKQAEEKMEKCIAQLHRELSTVRTGRANPLILDKVVVDYYGAPTGLRQLAQVSVAEGTTLVITPFDKTIIKEIILGPKCTQDPKELKAFLSYYGYNIKIRKSEIAIR